MTAMKKKLPFEILFLILLLPLIGIAYVAVQIPQVERKEFNNLESIVRLKAEQIEKWFDERQGDSEVLTGSVYLAQAVEQFIKTPNDPLLKKNLSKRLQLLNSAYGYESISLVDTQGKLLYGVGNNLDIPAIVQDLLRQSLNNKVILHTDLYREAAGHIHIDWVVPIVVDKDAGQHAIAAIILRVDPRVFLYPMIQTWPVASDSAASSLVQQEGSEVVFLNDLSQMKGSALQFKKPLAETGLPAVAAVQTQLPGTMRGSDYRGVEVLAAYRPIKGERWRLVAKIDRAEVLVPMWKSLYWMGAVASAAVFGFMLILFLVSRQKAYVQHLEIEAEKARANQLLRHFYEMPFVGMAITSPETKHWLQVNHRLSDMLGYSREDLLNKTWEEITHPQDLRADVKLFDRLLHGEIENYAIEKRFIRKDGRIISASLEVRCVRNPDGKVDYIMAMIADISEQKLAEKHAELLKLLYKDLVSIDEKILHTADQYQLLDMVCRIPIESGLMSMAWIGIEEPETQRIVPMRWRTDGIPAPVFLFSATVKSMPYSPFTVARRISLMTKSSRCLIR